MNLFLADRIFQRWAIGILEPNIRNFLDKMPRPDYKGNEKEEIHRNYEEVNSQAQEITTLSLEIAKMIGSCMTGIRKEAFGIACLYLIIPANRQL